MWNYELDFFSISNRLWYKLLHYDYRNCQLENRIPPLLLICHLICPPLWLPSGVKQRDGFSWFYSTVWWWSGQGTVYQLNAPQLVWWWEKKRCMYLVCFKKKYYYIGTLFLQCKYINTYLIRTSFASKYVFWTCVCVTCEIIKIHAYMHWNCLHSTYLEVLNRFAT